MQNLEELTQKKKDELAKYLPISTTVQDLIRKKNVRSWKEYCDNCPPDTFIIMHNLLTRKVTHTHNISQMGFNINHVKDIIQSTHEDHTSFVLHNLTCISLTIFKYHKGSEDLMNICYTSLRSLKSANNNYKYVKLISIPVTHDSNLSPIHYITWYTPIESYIGQPFSVNLKPIIPTKESSKIILTFTNLIKESFHYLSFTKRQKQIIQLINIGLNKQQISEQLKIAVRTVEKYNEQILNKGKILFRLNTFRSSEDVISHLSKMEILTKINLDKS